MKRKYLIIFVIIISGLGAALLLGGRGGSQPKAAELARPALTVTVEKPETRNWPQKFSASGNVQAWQEAVIGAEAGGLRLAELYVNVGDKVSKGQVLARFTDDMAALDLEQQRAAVDEARARFVQAAAKAESSGKLREAGMVSALDNIQNQSNAQIAKAQLQAAEARFKAQQLRLAYTRVRAPDDGIISARSATVGAVLQTGNEMFRYIRRNQVEWRAEVPEEPLQRIRAGQTVALHTALGDTLLGKVSRISPVVDTQSRNGSVFVELRKARGLRAGMFAQGEFELGRSSALTVAQAAVVMRDGYGYLFTVGADNRVTQRKVQAGRRQDGRIEIVQGLAGDAQVVTAGAGFLSDGDLVRVADARPASKSK